MKCEIFHDNFQNYKKYGIPKAQLVIADIPYNIGSNAIRCGIRVEITRTAKAERPKSHFSTRTGILRLQSICIFVQSCCEKNRGKKGKHQP